MIYDQASAKLILQPPVPRLDSEYQPGATDPIWPAEAPAGADPTVYRDRYAGQLDRQRHLHIITADVSVRSRPELAELLKRLTSFAKHQMAKLPVYDGIRKYDERAESRRVTVTIGFGATLFTTADGDDRFGLAGRKPTWLKVIPNTEGDAPTFVPRDHGVFCISPNKVYSRDYECMTAGAETAALR
jgi:deferrochelatase/peroxidase EfeB